MNSWTVNLIQGMYMTPLVREWSGIVNSEPNEKIDVTELHWFDITNIIDSQFYIDPEEQKEMFLTMRPPFEKCAAVGRTYKPGVKMDILLILLHSYEENATFITAHRAVDGQEPISSPITILQPKNGTIYFDTVNGEKLDDSDKKFIAGCVSVFFSALKTGGNYYRATVRDGYTSRKRVAKGLSPFYDWRTVVIEPQKPSQNLGGTHASPRLHERRGHLRKLKSGKQVWVKSHWVGDGSKGTVFHDYKFKEMAA